MRTRSLPAAAIALSVLLPARAITQASAPATTMKPEETEVWQPVPRIVTPGKTNTDAPSDAIVLFDGRDQAEWVTAKDGSPAKWAVANGILTVVKSAGDIQTKRSFSNYQLHLEWQVPTNVFGSGQLRGNSGIYLAYVNGYGYELQILDSYKNETYVNGQAASIYKQWPPLVNAMRPPGEWQTYDVIWIAPTFKSDGSLATPAWATVLHNGIVVQNGVTLKGDTKYIGRPEYRPHGPAPIMLQAHGDPSPAVSFRNIWIRELPSASP